eukprot:Skav211981  [mRNA]  locus=scaffold1330:233097:236289:- [translate_table: standard]
MAHDEFVWRPRRRRSAAAVAPDVVPVGGGHFGGDALGSRGDSRVSRESRVAFAEPEATVIVEGDPWVHNDPWDGAEVQPRMQQPEGQADESSTSRWPDRGSADQGQWQWSHSSWNANQWVGRAWPHDSSSWWSSWDGWSGDRGWWSGSWNGHWGVPGADGWRVQHHTGSPSPPVPVPDPVSVRVSDPHVHVPQADPPSWYNDAVVDPSLEENPLAWPPGSWEHHRMDAGDTDEEPNFKDKDKTKTKTPETSDEEDASFSVGDRFLVGYILDNAEITLKDRVMLLAAAQNQMTTASIFPALRRMGPFLQGTVPVGKGVLDNPLLPELRPDQEGGSSKWTPDKDKKWGTYRAHVAEAAEGQSTGYEDDAMSVLHSSLDLDEDLVPEELEAATHAALAAFNSSQNRLRAIKQARGYFKRTEPTVNPDRKERLKKLMAENPCRNCGQLGHWSKDPECPKNQGRQSSALASSMSSPSTISTSGVLPSTSSNEQPPDEHSAMSAVLEQMVRESARAYIAGVAAIEARHEEQIEDESLSPVEVVGESEVDWEEEELEPPSLHHKRGAGTRQDASMSSASVVRSKSAPKKKEQGAARSSSQAPKEKVVVSSKTRTKQDQTKEITGELANFPTLGMTVSSDAVFNASWIIHGRLVTHKWKQLTWMLRIKEAFIENRMTWKRNPRWLALMFSREMAALWGHIGCCSRVLSGPKGPPLMR